jgi:hypothetical protein
LRTRLKFLLVVEVSWDGSVSFLSGYGLHGRASIRGRHYSCFHPVFTVSDAHADLVQWISVALSSVNPHSSPGVKVIGHLYLVP